MHVNNLSILKAEGTVLYDTSLFTLLLLVDFWVVSNWESAVNRNLRWFCKTPYPLGVLHNPQGCKYGGFLPQRLGSVIWHRWLWDREITEVGLACPWVFSRRQKSEIQSTRRIRYAVADEKWRRLHVKEGRWPWGAKGGAQLAPSKETGTQAYGCKILNSANNKKRLKVDPLQASRQALTLADSFTSASWGCEQRIRPHQAIFLIYKTVS